MDDLPLGEFRFRLESNHDPSTPILLRVEDDADLDEGFFHSLLNSLVDHPKSDIQFTVSGFGLEWRLDVWYDLPIFCEEMPGLAAFLRDEVEEAEIDFCGQGVELVVSLVSAPHGKVAAECRGWKIETQWIQIDRGDLSASACGFVESMKRLVEATPFRNRVSWREWLKSCES